jgi:HEAT repeat protein
MKNNITFPIFMSCLLALLVFSVQAMPVSELLAEMPAKDATRATELFNDFIKQGPDGVRELCLMLTPPEKGGDANVRYALSGLSAYVSRPHAGRERRLYARALVGSLEEVYNTQIKAFIIRQLQLAGGNESVTALGLYLDHEKLSGPAARALRSIGTREAEAVLRKALADTNDKNSLNIILALGDLRSKRSASPLIKLAGSQDKEVSKAALHALANIGSSKAGKTLEAALSVTEPMDRARNASLYLLYAQRLAESGRKRQCERICREMIDARLQSGETHLACAALSILVDTRGRRALPVLLSAMKYDGKQYRQAALKLAASIPGSRATKQWIAKMHEVPMPARAEIVAMLGRRGDILALPVVQEAMSDTDTTMRQQATIAAARLGGSDILPSLLAALKTENADEIETIRLILMTLDGTNVTSQMADALTGVPVPSRIAILQVLAARRAAGQVEAVFARARDDNKEVRLTAIKSLEYLTQEKHLPRLVQLIADAKTDSEIEAAQKTVVVVSRNVTDKSRRADAVLVAFANASGENRIRLMQTLPRIGGQSALDATLKDTKSKNEEYANAAVRALSDWKDSSAADELIRIADSTDNLMHHVLTLRGYVRIVRASKLASDKKVNCLGQAISIAKRIEEKRQALAGLADIHTTASLIEVVKLLNYKGLKKEAVQAATKICGAKKFTGLKNADSVAALRKAISDVDDSKVKVRLEKWLKDKRKR